MHYSDQQLLRKLPKHDEQSSLNDVQRPHQNGVSVSQGRTQ